MLACGPFSPGSSTNETALPDGEPIEGVLEHAALLEVHVVSVNGLDIAVHVDRKQLRDTTSWLPHRGCHSAPLSSCVVVQPAPCGVERLAERPRARASAPDPARQAPGLPKGVRRWLPLVQHGPPDFRQTVCERDLARWAACVVAWHSSCESFGVRE